MINILILGLVLSLVIAVLFGIKRQKRVLINKQLTGVNSIININDLVKLLQKHRGLSAALCSGDDSVVRELGQLVNNIRSLISKLNKLPNMNYSGRWLSFNDHWSRLSQHQKGISADNSFKQHTNIIANILYLLEDVAEQHSLTKEYLADFVNIGFLWRELLAIIESVGQSRAVGTRTVTIKYCSSVDKIKLKFLQQHISVVSEEVLKTLLDNSQQRKFVDLVEQSLTSTHCLTTTITNDILDVDKIVIDRTVYFELATDTMEKLNQVFSYQVEQLQQSLQK
ncbi:MAG: hypothetical protein ACJAXJ_001729 [Colwellia sp.]|jgi:hypothetical protein